jgi:putative nucleotidyltransferase with HDIG domain
MSTTETTFLSPSSPLADREQARKVAVLLVMAVATSKGSYPEHSLAVADLSRAVGVGLVLGEEALEVLLLGALLHDVGKLGVPGTLLHKISGPLTQHEREFIERHSEMGARMIEQIWCLRRVAPVIRHHHERYDGSGYPDGLEAREIPFTARIVAATDAYDAMVRSRPYRERRSPTEAIGELTRGAGSQFDSEVVAILARVAVP